MAKQKLSKEALEFFRKQGRKGGKIGGKKRMEALTPEQRAALAKKAVAAREAYKTGEPSKRGRARRLAEHL
jgi:hypothetical protein